MNRLILGCGNFGGIGSAPAFFGQGESEEEAFALMDAAWELGFTRFDTADAYGGGRSETWIGRWMADRGHRPALTTKVFHSVVGDPSDRGLARDRILRQIEGSLERLGIERVDTYMIHEPDPDTPVAETVQALAELLDAGRIGAIGASNVDRRLAGGGAGRRAGRRSCRTRTRCSIGKPRGRFFRSVRSGASRSPSSDRSRAAGWPGSTDAASRPPRDRE